MKKIIAILFSMLVLGFFLRVIGINWDAGYYLHPDERAIFMFSLPIYLPSSIQEFFSTSSPLNPTFFAYGSFPLYTLRFFSYVAGMVDANLASYSGAYFVGRFISITLDTFMVLLIYFVSSRVFSRAVGVVAGFFYAISVFPIQTSHFYTADTFLSFFLLLSFLLLILFMQKRPPVPSCFVCCSVWVGYFKQGFCFAICCCGFLRSVSWFFSNCISHAKAFFKKSIIGFFELCFFNGFLF